MCSFDGGENWNFTRYPEVNFNSNSKFQISKNFLSIVVENSDGEPIMLKSFDRGITWEVHEFPNQFCDQVVFVNENFGYTVCNISILKTENGGESWENINIPTGFNDFQSLVHFSTPEQGFVIFPEWESEIVGIEEVFFIAFYHVFQTTDGGTTWTESKIEKECSLSGLFFSAANDLFFSVHLTSNRFEMK